MFFEQRKRFWYSWTLACQSFSFSGLIKSNQIKSNQIQFKLKPQQNWNYILLEMNLNRLELKLLWLTLIWVIQFDLICIWGYLWIRNFGSPSYELGKVTSLEELLHETLMLIMPVLANSKIFQRCLQQLFTESLQPRNSYPGMWGYW